MGKGGVIMDVVIWLAIAAVMIIVEIVTLGLTTIWFAGGALISALIACFGDNWFIQLVVFAVVSLVLLIFTRPIAQKHLMKDPEKTNVEGLIGEKAYVTESINNIQSKGAVKLKGVEWTARSFSDEPIAEGEEVIVKAVSGVKLIVSKYIRED